MADTTKAVRAVPVALISRQAASGLYVRLGTKPRDQIAANDVVGDAKGADVQCNPVGAGGQSEDMSVESA